jgi:hypothetical protein
MINMNVMYVERNIIVIYPWKITGIWNMVTNNKIILQVKLNLIEIMFNKQKEEILKCV